MQRDDAGLAARRITYGPYRRPLDEPFRRVRNGSSQMRTPVHLLRNGMQRQSFLLPSHLPNKNVLLIADYGKQVEYRNLDRHRFLLVQGSEHKSSQLTVE